MLQLTVLRKHSLVPPQFFAPSLIHGYRFSPRYVVTLLSLPASFNRAYTYTFGPSSCCSTNLTTPPLSSQSSKLSSRSYPVAVHHRRRPLHLRHESQHRSLTGVRPLERAYCHER